jgi:GNAT superfamily N-acetyltransferase
MIKICPMLGRILLRVCVLTHRHDQRKLNQSDNRRSSIKVGHISHATKKFFLLCVTIKPSPLFCPFMTTPMPSPDSTSILILPFQNPDRQGLAELVLPIQQAEFGIRITLDEQPDLLDPQAFFQRGNGNLWLAKAEAKAGDEIVGSIGLLDIGNGQTALRKMFVKAAYRGAQFGVASRLLSTLIAHCRTNAVAQIYLGTTSAYLAAHRFYEKNGFVELARADLPASFPQVSVDSKFYCFEVGGA